MAADLSVIIITQNEQEDIEECLKSVSELAAEIVVVDSGSTDETLSICRRYTNKIFHKDWNGFSEQKQYALDKAKGPWVLNIDADERVSKALRAEIQEMLTAPGESLNAFQIPFHNFFMGRRLRFGGSTAETHIRLFKKAEASYGSQSVHEGIKVKPPVGDLSGAIDHYSYKSVQDYLEKCNRYTSMIAQEKFKRGERFRFWQHFRLPYEFLVRYGIKLGFLDGEVGFKYALLSAYYVWMKYIKLKDLEASK